MSSGVLAAEWTVSLRQGGCECFSGIDRTGTGLCRFGDSLAPEGAESRRSPGTPLGPGFHAPGSAGPPTPQLGLGWGREREWEEARLVSWSHPALGHGSGAALPSRRSARAGHPDPTPRTVVALGSSTAPGRGWLCCILYSRAGGLGHTSQWELRTVTTSFPCRRHGHLRGPCLCGAHVLL